MPVPDTIDDDLHDFLTIDWEALQERNVDVIGWIHVPGTNINYPILQGENHDTYLRHDIDRNESIAGSIFMEERNSADFTDLSTIIYGHNMLNGSKFSDIEAFITGGLGEMPEYVYIYLPNQTVNLYRIIAASTVDAFSDVYALPIVDIEAYYDLIIDGSVIETVEFDRLSGSRVLTLSTCETADPNGPSRLVIHGVLIQEVHLGVE
jgi:sortase B